MPAVQEVQSNHFYDFLQPELLKHGYSAVYKKKTMEIYTGNSYAIDGCATFFKKDKFGLVKKYEVSLARQLTPLRDNNMPSRHRTVLVTTLVHYSWQCHVAGKCPHSSCPTGILALLW